MSDAENRARPSRRSLFIAAGSAAAAGVAGWMTGAAVTRPGGPEAGPASGSPGVTQALPDADRRPGITFPDVPQRHALVVVLAAGALTSEPLRERVRSALGALPPQPSDAGEVTVTIGFAPHHARALWPERAVAASDLPPFATDTTGMLTGGDLAIQVCAETVSAVTETARAAMGALGGLPTVWQQWASRDAPTPDGTARTSIGFIDGIINPRTPEELAAGVWSDAALRDTHWIVRRIRIGSGFTELPVAAQERAIGRTRDTGAPLSGGGPLDEIDLFEKEADGELLVPLDAHARRAHPANIGRALMLRRSYSADDRDGAALLFTAFTSDPTTFVTTQRRLEESDALIAHSTVDASGAFFVPGDL